MDKIKSGADFDRYFRGIAKRVLPNEFNLVFRQLMTNAFADALDRSATDTGWYRNNWDISINQKIETKLDNPFPSEVRGKGLELALKPDTPKTARQVKYGDIATLYNNTVYAKYLEEGRKGKGGQAQPVIPYVLDRLEREAKTLLDNLSRKRIS